MDNGKSKEESVINEYSQISIKDILKEVFEENGDGICFLPQEDDELSIRSFIYKKKSKPEVCEIGHSYHIMIYKVDDYGNLYAEDNFEAILTDPSVYAEWVINCGFYGIISKKTKNSKKFLNAIYKELLDSF